MGGIARKWYIGRYTCSVANHRWCRGCIARDVVVVFISHARYQSANGGADWNGGDVRWCIESVSYFGGVCVGNYRTNKRFVAVAWSLCGCVLCFLLLHEGQHYDGEN